MTACLVLNVLRGFAEFLCCVLSASSIIGWHGLRPLTCDFDLSRQLSRQLGAEIACVVCGKQLKQSQPVIGMAWKKLAKDPNTSLWLRNLS